MAGPDIKAIDALPGAILGKDPVAPEPDTKNLDALLASLNGSAERFQTLWFSFLGLTLYLAIAALATTHRNLLLGEPQTLPILNIKVELLPFYVIAPLLYFVFHFYLLMMLLLLARSAAPFEQQLHITLPIEADRELYRTRVENALFLQMLVGPKPEREGLNGRLLAAIALITIVLAPLATLILIQMMFLPYHSLAITWWHRVLVLADLTLIIVLWRRYYYQSGIERPPLLFGRLDRLTNRLILTAAVLWLAFWEGRWAGEPWIGRRDLASTANGVVFGLFPNRLKLKDETIVGKEKLDKTKEEMASRGGEFAFVPTIRLDGRDLQAADLSGADLRGASLEGAALQGANLNVARLDGARLVHADLAGAILVGAQLQSANLEGAKLQGAELNNSGFQDAELPFAQLQGADLSFAHFQAAVLQAAQLQGANITNAELQGADLRNAQLQGAVLFLTHLQGADLGDAEAGNADLSDSDLDKTFVFRTHISNAKLATASIRSVVPDKLDGSLETETLTDADVDKWMASTTGFAPEKDKAQIIWRFRRLKPDFREEDPNETKWVGMEEVSLALDPDGSHFRHRLAMILEDLACSAQGAPYVARSLIWQTIAGRTYRRRLALLGDQLDVFRTRLEEGRKDLEDCPGVVGLTEKNWRELETIQPSEATPADH
jgi:uncharacterized protein YjbI with pentapeptide repeats